MTSHPQIPVRVLAALLTLGALSLPGLARAEGERIAEIEIAENSKTSDETVLVIADVEVGDTFNFELADRIKVDLVNSGLFKDVNVFSSPHPLKQGQVLLTIVAKDKFSWVIAPTLYLQPGNTGGGVGFAENNLFGEAKKILIYGQIATADSLFLAGYVDPSIAGTRFYWRLDTFLRREIVSEFDSRDEFLEQPERERLTTMNYLNGGYILGVNLWKGMAFDFRMRGAYVTYRDAEWADAAIENAPETHQGTPPAPDKDGWDVSTEVKLTRDKRANWYGVTTGSLFQLSYETGLPSVGSDWSYDYGTMKLHIAKKYWSRHNFVAKFGAMMGRNLPFQQEFTSGGTNLRGYQNRQFRGDTKVGSTLEYSVPFFTIGSVALRGLVFYDSAYTAFNNTDENESRNYLIGQTDNQLSKWRNGVGGGFRIYMRSVVIPLLGLDWGYGLETGEYNLYFAIGLTEL